MNRPLLVGLAMLALMAGGCAMAGEEPADEQVEVVPQSGTAQPANGYTLVSQSYCASGFRLACNPLQGTCRCVRH